jgi:hypothetical protein
MSGWNLPNRNINTGQSRASSPAPSVNNSRPATPATPTGKTPKVVSLPRFQVGLPNRNKNGTPIQYVFGKGRKSRRNRKNRNSRKNNSTMRRSRKE